MLVIALAVAAAGAHVAAGSAVTRHYGATAASDHSAVGGAPKNIGG
jgi:hypothetical protein